ncbi:hypothetical protein [Kitasatospora sp. NPDC088134]|uniref:hypothetical protein n=1 Tax=Kitasatospora sp. NPDC088134 TaxID=3364071 RepID=UPI00382613E4
MRARVLLAGSEAPGPWETYRAHRLLARVAPAVHLPRLALAAVEMTVHPPVAPHRDLQLGLMAEALAAFAAIDPADPFRPRALAVFREKYRERAELLGIDPEVPFP